MGMTCPMSTNLHNQNPAPARWRLCVLISQDLCPGREWWQVAQAVIAHGDPSGGNLCVQLREKHLDDRELLDRAIRLVALCRPRGVNVIINDRPDIALLANADGVHLGQADLPTTQVRGLVGPRTLIGISTSNLSQAKQALIDGADYCGVGPMFPTATKQKDALAGPTYLREYLAWGGLPHLAIGGITNDNANRLIEEGVQGIAVSSAVCSAQDPSEATAQLIHTLSQRA